MFLIVWGALEVQDMIKTTIEFLIKGCTCKKGCMQVVGVTERTPTVAEDVNAWDAAT